MERSGGYRGRGGRGGGGSGGDGWRGERGGGSGGDGRRGGYRGGRGGGQQYRRRDQPDQHEWRSSGQGGGQGPPPWHDRPCAGGNSSGGRGVNRGAWVPNRGRGPAGPPVATDHAPNLQRGNQYPPESVLGPVVSEMAEFKISQQLPSSSSSEENPDRIVPVKRPDKGGTLGTQMVMLRANHFLVKYDSERIIKHYDFDVKSEMPVKNGYPKKISKSDLSVIRNKLFTENHAEFPMSFTAYDGEKNIFSAVPLPTGTFKVLVGEEGRHGSYVVSIKLVSEVKYCRLDDYLSGIISSIPRYTLQAMELAMKENPNNNMIPVGRCFHPFETYPEDDLGCGIIASRGIQHSLKLTSQGLALCLDYSVLAFRKKMPVVDFLREHIHGFNLNDFERFRKQVEIVLRGLKVTVIHRTTKQKYVVAGLTRENTRNLSFTAEDTEGNVPARQVSIIAYFREKYKKEIVYKGIPCLDLGKNNRKNHVPMEFCVLVEGQVYPKENLDRNAALELKDKSLAQPAERERRICDMVQSTEGPCRGQVVSNFGIEVDMQMTSLVGRVLAPPELKLGASNGKLVKIPVDKVKCQWNLVGKALVDGKPIQRWAVVDFSSAESNRFKLNPGQFIPRLIARCKNLGIRMEEPLIYERSTMKKFTGIDMLRELLEKINDMAYNISQGHLQIVLCVMSRKDPGYKYLKWISETRVGVITQCCLSTNANNGNDQYLANLALKINAKLGGSNVELIGRLPYFKDEKNVMFVGADVNHPDSRNKMIPSIAAIVATVNWPAANRYAARVRPQEHRKEKILHFGDMCLELVETYARINKAKPDKIVVFRDGVSEGQFDMVLNEELIDIKRAFGRINYSPPITIIVAQKRHQTRLFPKTQREGSSTGNVPPGTVVDTKIIHPFEFDFYLCSHYGTLGTSKPTHYHVLWDENGINSDQLQKLIYDMCFTFARCTKPVSLVPPVYYADLVAYRGRLYYEAVIEGQSPISAASLSSLAASSSSSSLSSAASLDDRFYKLHADLENIMFFV
ncbi:protein argonaute 2-like isoform X2 [Tripterygium wilfordii]|uniref:Protein argonaute 2-like isoform X2 n=1 Tax=Tripterygium wilfordii TaxID=458696 RepID=A0A7J7C3P5_TRIWF|nr:protein argonaute 2-like [Tripterygium wilfordii]KAF5728742.1 protein argonaute 2-like isoform X2 [Tripterygium wilfordii]